VQRPVVARSARDGRPGDHRRAALRAPRRPWRVPRRAGAAGVAPPERGCNAGRRDRDTPPRAPRPSPLVASPGRRLPCRLL